MPSDDMKDADRKRPAPQEELNRRQWLLRLGETAVLMGFQGMAGGGASLSPETAPQPVQGSPTSLPPGLYEASNDAMTHALMADDRFHPVPTGSPTDFTEPRSGPFQPQFFSGSQFATVKRLVELTLGEDGSRKETTTAQGEADVVDEIAEWIDLVTFNAAAVREAARRLAPQHRTLAIAFFGSEEVRRLETDDPDKTWREGLMWLAEESRKRYGKPFLDLPASEQTELWQSTSNERSERGAENAGTRLFALVKSQAARGFYTSPPGLKELDYKGNSFQAECPGCSGREH